MKRFGILLISTILLMNTLFSVPVYAETEDNQLNITSTSAVLIEGSTGVVIYEKNKDEKLRPASITKIMTLLLIFEALDSGKIKLTDMVTISEHAASMGGSQVFLEPYEQQDVNTMIKCISIASANDACASYRLRNLNYMYYAKNKQFVIKRRGYSGNVTSWISSHYFTYNLLAHREWVKK